MPPVELNEKELAILDFVLMDLAEAIEDGDRREFDAREVNELMQKVLAARQQLGNQESESGGW
jgi:hypothetical protein